MPDLSVSALMFMALIVAIIGFLGAVWFGLFVLAPTIQRMLDRAQADDEEPGDPPD